MTTPTPRTAARENKLIRLRKIVDIAINLFQKNMQDIDRCSAQIFVDVLDDMERLQSQAELKSKNVAEKSEPQQQVQPSSPTSSVVS